MPKKFYPSETDFAEFENQIQALGYRKTLSREFANDFRRYGLAAPSPREGREVGYTFTANELTARVWTSWVPTQKGIRELDAGWVLICSGERAPYFARPLNRTKYFLRNLLSYAWIARWRVINRPLCPECRAFMNIAFGRAIKQRYWLCTNIREHKSRKTMTKPWDLDGLPPRAQQFVDLRRATRAHQKKENLKKGIQTKPAVLIRTGWKKTRTPGKASK